MPRNRKYPHGDKEYCALDVDFWTNRLDITQKVAVYWCLGGDELDVVGYYETYALGAAARLAAAKPNGDLPHVAINWDHPDITHIVQGPVAHPDARVALPSWTEED